MFHMFCYYHYWRRLLCRVSGVLGKDSVAFGKEFSAKVLMVKKSLPRALSGALGKGFAESSAPHSAKKSSR
jgi:hypothetical protein